MEKSSEVAKQRRQIERRLQKHKEWLKDEFEECVDRAAAMAKKWDLQGRKKPGSKKG